MAEETPEPPLMQADETLSPVDLPGAPEESALAWASVAIGVAALFLLLTNAATLDGWARDLPPGPYAERATEASGRWAASTDRFGLGSPHAALHALWKKAEAARFQ